MHDLTDWTETVRPACLTGLMHGLLECSVRPVDCCQHCGQPYLGEIDPNVRPSRCTTATAATACRTILPRHLPFHAPVHEPHVSDTAVGDGSPIPITDLSIQPIADTDIYNANPTPTPPGLAGRASASRTVDPLDLGPMNILCDHCEAPHWIDEPVPLS